MAGNTKLDDTRVSIRKRPGMYFGSTGSHGVLHAINELVSNGIDLFLNGSASRVGISFEGETISCTDDGPGLPYDLPGPGGDTLAEHYLTHYHDTPTADSHAPHVHLISHGLGLMCVNAVSEFFEVRTWRSGRLWTQRFHEGLPVQRPQIAQQGPGKGTSLSFRLDSKVFSYKLPDRRMLRRMIFEAAHLFSGITLDLARETFFTTNGLADLAALYYQSVPFEDPKSFSLSTLAGDVQIGVATIGESSSDATYRSWANGASTSLRGSHVDGLRDALRWAGFKPALGLIHVVMHHPEFAGPTRGCLNNPEVRTLVRERLKPALKSWLQKETPGERE